MADSNCAYVRELQDGRCRSLRHCARLNTILIQMISRWHILNNKVDLTNFFSKKNHVMGATTLKRPLTSSGTAKNRVTSLALSGNQAISKRRTVLRCICVIRRCTFTRPHRPYPVPPQISPPSSSSYSSYWIA